MPRYSRVSLEHLTVFLAGIRESKNALKSRLRFILEYSERCVSFAAQCNYDSHIRRCSPLGRILKLDLNELFTSLGWSHIGMCEGLPGEENPIKSCDRIDDTVQ